MHCHYGESIAPCFEDHVGLTFDMEKELGTPAPVASPVAAAPVGESPVAPAGTTTSHPTFDPTVSLEQLRSGMERFADEREWGQFHTPRNLLLALVGEVGEVSECFQWRGEVPVGCPGWSARDREHLGEELSDVLLYLVRLSDRCGVDLGAAALRKMRLNAAKYPVDQAKGRSDKYTAYGTAAGTSGDGLEASTAGPVQ